MTKKTIKTLIFANMIAICGYSCSSGSNSIKYAKIHELEKSPKVEIEGPDSGLFPEGILTFFQPKVKGDFSVKSKYNQVLAGRLTGHGKEFEEAAAKYNVPIGLLIGICLHEVSPQGNSQMIKKYNNVAGNLVKNKKTGKWESRKFTSIRESIYYTSRNLRVNYLDKGLTTIAQIKAKYAPAKAANDPKGKNACWTVSVTKYKAKIDAL